jgi:hypothetical protein
MCGDGRLSVLCLGVRSIFSRQRRLLRCRRGSDAMSEHLDSAGSDSVANICVDVLPSSSCYCPQPYLRPFCPAYIHPHIELFGSSR